MKKLKDKISRFFQECYGMDELGKTLITASIIFYFLGALLKNGLCFSICLFLFIFCVYRMLSKNNCCFKNRTNKPTKEWHLI